MGGLVAELCDLPALIGEVQLGVKGAHGLVGDLEGTDEYSHSQCSSAAGEDLYSPTERRLRTFHTAARALTGLRFYTHPISLLPLEAKTPQSPTLSLWTSLLTDTLQRVST